VHKVYFCVDMVYSAFVSDKKQKETKKFQVKRASRGAGLGLYTIAPFKKESFVIEYIGPVITSTKADKKGGKYLFDINSRWTIDGTIRSNIARYINHSCRPNCEAKVRGKLVKIYARRNISAGEELNYDYGKEYFDEFIKPIGCKCDACIKNHAADTQ